FKNNLVYKPSGVNAINFLGATSAGNHTIDYNHYYLLGAPTYVAKIDGINISPSQWNARGYDMHSKWNSFSLSNLWGTSASDYKFSSGSMNNANTGTAVNLFNDDIDGIRRPQGGAWDVGAHEYAGVALPAPSPSPVPTPPSLPSPTPSNVNVSPTIALSSPINNTVFKLGASVAISATASDVDGFVSKVEFFNGQTKIGED